MARIDGKPSRRRPGYTKQDIEAARKPPTPTRRTAKLVDAREVDRRMLDIADTLLSDDGIDAPRDRQG